MRIFITYGDKDYETAKNKIVTGAELIGEFDEIYAYGIDDLSPELICSEVFKIKRGGGLWSWKPDIIYTTMQKHQNGDILVYCDAGCTLYPSKEWKRYWQKLEKYDIIAQRIYQRTDKWTRREIITHFKENGISWLSLCQFQATVIIFKVSDFTRQFVREWRNLMIEYPEFAMDVSQEHRSAQLPCFIENRHDQAIYSALIYKYLNNPLTHDKIHTQWEHIEDLDPFFKQAIRATRLRQGQEESANHKSKAIIKRLIKDYCLKPFYYIPLQWWHSKKNIKCITKERLI